MSLTSRLITIRYWLGRYSPILSYQANNNFILLTFYKEIRKCVRIGRWWSFNIHGIFYVPIRFFFTNGVITQACHVLWVSTYFYYNNTVPHIISKQTSSIQNWFSERCTVDLSYLEMCDGLPICLIIATLFFISKYNNGCTLLHGSNTLAFLRHSKTS